MRSNKWQRALINKTIFLLSSLLSVLLHQNANALFVRSTANDNRPVFVDEQDYSLYFNVGGGVMMAPFFSNIVTMNLSDSDSSNSLQQMLGKTATNNLQGKYAPYFNIAIGYKSFESIVRHEIEFSYLETSSSVIGNLTGTTANALNGGANNATTSVNYMDYNGRAIKSIGTYARYLQLMYKPYLHFDDLFDIFGQKFDFFVNGGVGFAVVEGGVSVGSEYTRNAQGALTTTLKTNDIDNYTDGSKNTLVSMRSSFAIALEAGAGVVYNINSVIAMQAKAKYQFISKPVFGTDFSNAKSTSDTNAHLLHFFGLEISILLKAI